MSDMLVGISNKYAYNGALGRWIWMPKVATELVVSTDLKGGSSVRIVDAIPTTAMKSTHNPRHDALIVS